MCTCTRMCTHLVIVIVIVPGRGREHECLEARVTTGWDRIQRVAEELALGEGLQLHLGRLRVRRIARP